MATIQERLAAAKASGKGMGEVRQASPLAPVRDQAESLPRPAAEQMTVRERLAAAKAFKGDLAGRPYGQEEQWRQRTTAGAFGGGEPRLYTGGFTGGRESGQTGAGTRVGKSLSGAGKSYAADMVGAVGAAMNFANARQQDLVAPLMGGSQGENSFLQRAWEYQQARDTVNKASTQAVQLLGDQLAQSAQEDIDAAKKGLGSLGQAAVDVGVGGAQLLGDLAIGAVTGGGTIIPLMVRSFGGSARQALQEGATAEQAAMYGLSSALLEAATEKISSLGNFNTAAFGSGAVDDILEGIVGAVERLGKTEAGRAVLNRVASTGIGFISEGFEEFISGVVSPLLQKATYGKALPEAKDVMSDAMYEFLIGGAIGAISGGLGGTDTKQIQQAYFGDVVDRETGRAYQAMRENGMFSQQGREAMQQALDTMQRAGQRTGTHYMGDPNEKYQQSASNRGPGVMLPRAGEGPVMLPRADDTQGFGSKKAASTGEAGNGIVPFSEKEAQNLTSAKGIVNGYGGTFRQFIDSVKTLGNTVRFYFGKVSTGLGTQIESAVGKNVSGYTIAIRSDEVTHALQSHGDAEYEARRGQLPVTAETLERLPEIFDKPNEVVLLNKKDYAGRTAFEVRKWIDGYMVAVVGISDGKHSVEVDSVRIINKKAPPATVDETGTSPNHTSETSGRSALSGTTIPQAGGNVKAEMYARRLERAGESVETAARLGGLIARAERGQLLTAGEDMAIRENKNAAQLLAAVRARAESAVGREGQAVTGAQGIMLPTYAETERRNRAARASTELERSGILAGVPDEDVALAKRLSGAIGRDIVFYREGATEQGIRNGFFSSVDGKIHVNAESRNPLAQIVSHELTHSVELADAYGRLQGIVLRRIQETGGDLAALRQEKRDLYARNGVALGSEGEIDQEIVAEYVEQYLLTDEESILELTRQDRGLARRILDWLDSILARLGSRAAKERVFLTEARAAYAKALEETTEAAMRAETAMALESLREDLASGRITEAEFDEAMEAIRQEEDLAGVSQVERNSISETESGEPFVEVEEDILDGVPEADWVSTVKENLKQKFPNGVTVGNSKIKINAQSTGELTNSEYSKWMRDNAPVEYADKFRATNNADEILDATQGWVGEGLKHPRKDNIKEFARGRVLLRIGGNDYNAEVVVGTTKGNSMLLYDIVNLQPTSIKEKSRVQTAATPNNGISDRTPAPVSSNSIFAKTPNVNSKFSVSKDPGPLPVILPGGETVSARDSLPAKARSYLERVERAMLNGAGEALGVSQFANRESLANMVRELSTEYLERGKVSQETTDRLFDQAYEAGIVADTAFYDQYRELKNHLRGQAVTIADQDKADIADFNSFRKSAFGTLNIVNEGGMPVDEAYQELRGMAPELFPDLTHPADQLKRMFEVGRSIRKAEYTLEQYHSGDPAAKTWARRDFEAAISGSLSELRNVKRYAEDRARRAEGRLQGDGPQTQEEVAALYGQLKNARSAYEKAAARNLLTEEDEKQVGKLLRGELELAGLDPKRDNVRGITAVYEAKEEYERLTRQIRQWNQARKAALRSEADEDLATANSWKDKKRGIQYSRETMERNIRDIVPDPALAERIIGKYFKPVHDGAAAANRAKNQYRDRVRALGLSRKVEKGNAVSEAHAVQLLGEAEDNIRVLERSRGRLRSRDGKSLEDWRGIINGLWAENPGLKPEKIRSAVNAFRSIYDELFQQMNDARIRNGYEPVNYRQGYFPHFQPGAGDGIMAHFGKALGISTEVTALPTTINGMTHTFKPGIRWFGNAQERLGFNTAYDAVEGFDRYIEGVADVIYQTDNIQRLRALASQARYRTGGEGIRKQVDAVRERTDLSEEQKQNDITAIYENGKFALSNFVVELDEYTNLLANKKSRADRNMEQALGRDIYNLMKALESRVAANMVAINPASWLTNFIPLTQGGATLDRGMLLHGMWDTLRAIKEDDGIVGQSAFLTNRRGSDPLVRTWAQSASAAASRPMEWIDSFTADSLVRARYRQNLGRGLSEESAMGEADGWAAGVMADRSKGSTPTLFNRSNPLTKLFTTFQLEVNNQLSYVFKDMPRDMKDRGVAALAAALLKFMLGAFLYDEVYEYVIGRRPALDPLGILNDTVGDLTGYELPNLVELGVGAATGENPSFQVERKDAYGVMEGLAGNVAEELPFIGGVLGGGRVPISSALPDVGNLAKAAGSDKWDKRKKLAAAGKELAKPLYYMLPAFGGGQAKKAYEGITAVAKGGSYSVNSDGEDVLQYPIYNDSNVETGVNAARAALFGKTSLPTGREWIESGFKTLGAKETAVYKAALAQGDSGRDAYATIQDVRSEKKMLDKLGKLAHSPLSEEIKSTYLGGIMSDTAYARYQAASKAGLSTLEYYRLLDAATSMARKRTGKDDASPSQEDIVKALDKSGLNRRQKAAIWDSYGWKSENPWR